MPSGEAKELYAQQVQSYGEQPAEEKWEALSNSQKLDRLRLEALNTRHQLQWLTQRVLRLEEAAGKMRLHQHASDGQVMVRMIDAEHSRGEAGMAVSKAFDPLA